MADPSKVTLVRLVQPVKAELRIVDTPSMVKKPFNVINSMMSGLKEFGMVTLVSPMQSSNEYAPMVSTLDGMV